MADLLKGHKLTDSEAMTLAIAQSQKGLGWVSPNPAVGCVLLDNKNCLLSTGYHEKFGGPHAEINALNKLSEKELTGARVFVTLEPCAHQGKTPSCALALSKLPIAEVIFGLYDPNPLVQGKGTEIIKNAGIKITQFDQDLVELEETCEHFLQNMREQVPFVTLKVATSLDGKLALKNGMSQWITGSESRQESHFLRAINDVILVGVNTFLIDNPSLNIRHNSFPDKKNKVAILDPNGRGFEKIKSSNLYANHKPENIIWVSKNDIKTDDLNHLGIHIIKVPSIPESDDLNLKFLLSELWKINVKSILVEGGASTISSFLNQKICNRLSLFMAPIIIGEKSGIDWTSNLNSITELQQSVPLNSFKVKPMGKDLLLTARFL